ncbi:hypothetical protein [Streptomyces nigrescens]|uniref:hypothetical protein n=1 Tax=Streptomyces nigrescens TaxID=1920 RepID=UPI0036FF5E68
MIADDDHAARGDLDGADGTFAGGLLEMLKDIAAEHVREDQGPALVPLGGIGRFEGEVFVDLKETRFGRPLRVTRDLLKRGDSWGLQLRDVERIAHLSAHEAEEYLAQLVDAGYLTSPGAREGCYQCPGSECYHPDYRRWKLTAKGRTLGHASGRQPSTRKRADTLAAKVVKAAAAINEDPDALLWWVKEIRAAGAYADPQQDPLLHVDLAVELRPRLDDPAEQRKAEARLRDAAGDRHERVRAWDLNGYGHFQTRLTLAGRSKVVRMFQSDGDARGALLFCEDRDLTVKAPPTAAYVEPAEPEPLQRCSWCQRAELSERVAPRGEPVSRSPIGLCQLCSQLGHSTSDSFSWCQPRYWTLRETWATLTQEPYHAEGCALCGRPDDGVRSWWTDQQEGEKESAPIDLRLCSLCPGLLELADRPDREKWWHWRYQDACVAGMHQMMREAVNLPALPTKTVTRKPPRLTELHHTLLEEIRRRGVLSPADMARSASSQRHQNSRWWTVRFGHLLDNGLLTPLGAKATDVVDLHGATEIRATSEEERDLRRELHALFTPGPVWDGSGVREVDPPATWQSLRDRCQALAHVLDQRARALQAATTGTHL